MVFTENGNNPHGQGLMNLLNFNPIPKNPSIARVFREIGRADELGSGTRNLLKYGKIYGGKEPELYEGDVFRTVIWTLELGEIVKVISGAQSKGPNIGNQNELNVAEKIIQLLKFGEFSSNELMLKLGLIAYTIPEKPHVKEQKYRLLKKDKEDQNAN